jgi:hypothetical protein
MNSLDEKQKRLINAWLQVESADEYGRYMSTWIAFNALCHSLFAGEASRRRPDLTDGRGLNGIMGKVRAEGLIEVRADGRVSIRLDTPGRIGINIRERYTEELIFSAFARKFQSDYARWLETPQFSADLTNFLAAIRRPKGWYVINMLHVDEHNADRNPADMAARNIVVAITDRANLKELVPVLYQVRNNMFHGEKVPDDVNDDRIVKAARPFLQGLVRRAYDIAAEPGAAVES